MSNESGKELKDYLPVDKFSTLARSRAEETKRALRTTRDSRLLSTLDSAREIARMREPQRREEAELVNGKIVYSYMSDEPVLRSFRQLRTSLFQRAGTHNFVLSVAAVAPKGGGSFVARNLAAAVAFDDTKSALLIDCNPKSPSLESLALAEDRGAVLGFTDYLASGELRAEEIIYASGIPRLRVIPVGTRARAGSEFFSSPKLYTLVQELRQRYPERSVILDSPPLSEPDAVILSFISDFVLIVVPYGRVTGSQVIAAASSLEPNQLIGTVLNDVPKPLAGAS
jgi:Mrp family chromosome partitioning ATPase